MHESEHPHENSEFFPPGDEFLCKRLVEYFRKDGDEEDDPEELKRYFPRIFDVYETRDEE